MKKNYNNLFKILKQEILKNKENPLKVLLEEVLNELMKKERENYLKENKDYANGFYERKIKLTLGELNLKVPRVRIGKNFRPALLPPHWKRTYGDYEELLITLIINGYSRKQIKLTLKNLGLPYQEEKIKDILNEINETCDYFKSRPLDPDWLCIYIDAYKTKMRTENKKIKNIIIFVAIGITLEGKKEILSFWVIKGNENTFSWNQILQDLISRGVSKVMLFITDNFSGLNKLIKKYFPLSEHQFCMLHLIRNIKKITPKNEQEKIKRIWRNILNSENKEEGEMHFERLLNIIQKFKPKMKEKLQKEKDNYLTFLDFPDKIRKYLYSTNPVEGLCPSNSQK